MFSFNMFDHPIPRVFQSRFSTQYRCFSVSMLAGPNDRSDVEKGGKIIMPPSALDQLSRLNITYPMLFKLTNKNSDRMTHCGVLEFVADEGICYLPHWMMQNLLLEEGGLVQVESVNLQVATYSKFQPQSPDFLDITNPKAVYPQIRELPSVGVPANVGLPWVGPPGECLRWSPFWAFLMGDVEPFP